MSGVALVRPVESMMWELRTAWAMGKRVALSLENRGEQRIEGHVTRIAPTGAFVEVNHRHVAGDRILSIHLPSRLGDSTFDDKDDKPWHGRSRRKPPPQREELPLEADYEPDATELADWASDWRGE